MILDRFENLKTYLGLTPALDRVIEALSAMDLSAGLPAKADFNEESRFTVSEISYKASSGHFEYHRKYIDIHLPLTGGEQMGICSTAANTPDAAAFNEEKDCGFFDAPAVNTITVPAGWFCICFPDDAHEPSLGEVGTSYRKMVCKIPV